MPLTNTECANFKGKEKSYRKSDGGGLYMQVMPNGSKYWRFKYRYLKKEKHLALGVYPEVTLVKARKKRDEARELLADDVDPSEHKKKKRAEKLLNAENTLQLVAHEFIEKSRNTCTDKTVNRNLSILEKNVFPDLGNRAIKDIEPFIFLKTHQ